MRTTFIAVLALAWTPAAAAQDAPAPRASNWQVALSGGVWIPRMLGDASFGGETLDLDGDLSLRDTEAAVPLALELRKPGTGWSARLDGVSWSLRDGGRFRQPASFGDLSFAAGDPFRSRIDFASAAVSVTRWAHRPYDGSGAPVHMRFAPLIGARLVEVDLELRDGAGAESRADARWAGPMGGVEMVIEFDRDEGWPLGEALEIRGMGAVGAALGGDGGVMAEVRGEAGVRLNDDLTVLFGFHLLHVSAEDGAFDFDGGLQGLFLGLEWTF